MSQGHESDAMVGEVLNRSQNKHPLQHLRSSFPLTGLASCFPHYLAAAPRPWEESVGRSAWSASASASASGSVSVSQVKSEVVYPIWPPASSLGPLHLGRVGQAVLPPFIQSQSHTEPSILEK